MAAVPLIVLLFTSAAVVSAALTAAWIAFAWRRQIHDQPGPRRLHALPTPRGGGVAIALVFLAGLAWLSLNGQPVPGAWGLLLGVGSFAAIGFLDDLAPLPTLLKFALQWLAAAVLVLGVAGQWSLGWPWLAVLMLACCYVVNIWNFMDGSNGLITVQALLIALAVAFWPGQSGLGGFAALLLAGACAGFLPFNLPVARVFLGDVGSHALGAAVFGLLLLSWKQGSISLLQSILIMSALLIDSGLTLGRRLLSGRRVWRAHRDHLFQYAVRRGHSHTRVCLAYAAATGLAIGLAAIAGGASSRLTMPIALIFTWLLGTTIYFRLRQHWLDPGTHRGLGNA